MLRCHGRASWKNHWPEVLRNLFNFFSLPATVKPLFKTRFVTVNGWRWRLCFDFSVRIEEMNLCHYFLIKTNLESFQHLDIKFRCWTLYLFITHPGCHDVSSVQVCSVAPATHNLHCFNEKISVFLCQRICSCKVALEILKNACKKVFPSMVLVESLSCLQKLLNFPVSKSCKQTWKAARQTAARNEHAMQGRKRSSEASQ